MNNSIKVIDIPKEERPIEKLLINGPEILSNAELLAVILRTGTRGENVISLSTRILSEFDGLNGLLDIGISEITSIKGIKNIKIDTHEDNLIMQKLLEKNSFKYCGVIYLLDGSKRIAFEKEF